MTNPEPDREREKLLSWRRKVLTDAGFGELYVEVFVTAEVDLHRVVGLKEAGCADELIARILL